jgi:8-oxo-dGTP pyrophosphatase MutT (NUDIX family)
MAHDHITPGNYAYTASFFIIRTDFDEPRMVLHMHIKRNILQMFGGHVELGENIWETLVRELREETGYTPSEMKVLQPETELVELPGVVSHPTPLGITSGPYTMCDFEHFWTDTSYALVADSEPAQESGEEESKDLYYVTRAELEALTEAEMAPFWKKLALRAFDKFYEYHQVEMTRYSVSS